MYSFTLPLTSALDGVGVWRHAPAALTLGKWTGTHCIGGSFGPKVGLDGCGKSRPPPAFDHRTVHPVASRYTDWTTPVLHIYDEKYPGLETPLSFWNWHLDLRCFYEDGMRLAVNVPRPVGELRPLLILLFPYIALVEQDLRKVIYIL